MLRPTNVFRSLRSLAQTPTFAVAVVATIGLAVAIGATTFTVINAVLLRPLPYRDADRLVSLWHSFPGIGISVAEQAVGTYRDYHDRARAFESMGAFGDGTFTLTYADPAIPPERAHLGVFTASLLPTLGVHPAIGRNFTDDDDRQGAPLVALLSDAMWRERFHADPHVAGKTFQIEGRMARVVGVMPASFAMPSSDIRAWFAMSMGNGPYLGSFNLRAVARLRPRSSIDAARGELQQILLRTPERWPLQAPGLTTQSVLTKTRAEVVIHSLREDAIGDFGHILWLIGATSIALLLVALSNVTSLTLARVEARRRDFAVRAMLGASPMQVRSGMWTEAAIVSLAGTALGGGMAFVALYSLSRFGTTSLFDPMTASGGRVSIPRLNDIHPDWSFLLAAASLGVTFWVVSVGVGTWRAGQIRLAPGLHASDRGGTATRSSQRLRAAFVGAEVALSLVLLSGSFVLGRSLLRLRRVDTGFAGENVMTLFTSPPTTTRTKQTEIVTYYEHALATVRALPGVESAAATSLLPLAPGWRGALATVIEDMPRENGALQAAVQRVAITSGYFATMGIPLVAGRTFDDAAVANGAREVVIGRALALKYWGDSTGRRALGRRMRAVPEHDWFTVVGVVGDVRDTSLTAPPSAIEYLPANPGPDTAAVWPQTVSDMALVVRYRASARPTIASLERPVRAVNAQVAVYDAASMSDRITGASDRVRVAVLLLAVGAGATLLLGVIGLYSVIAYLVSLRTREIGIRIALGQLPGHATWAILLQSESIVMLGVGVGLALFVGFARLLRSLTYQIGALDPLALACATFLVLVVATAAAFIPARRAARIDPANALRAE